MHYTANMKINPLVTKDLVTLGQWLRILRKKRHLTLADICERLDVNPRTLSKIEKGDPSVSVGVFLQYLDILGLSQGLAERILGDYLLVVLMPKKQHVFRDDEMNF